MVCNSDGAWVQSEQLFRDLLTQVHTALATGQGSDDTVVKEFIWVAVEERVFCRKCGQSTDMGRKESHVSGGGWAHGPANG